MRCLLKNSQSPLTVMVFDSTVKRWLENAQSTLSDLIVLSGRLLKIKLIWVSGEGGNLAEDSMIQNHLQAHFQTSLPSGSYRKVKQ